MTRFHKLWSPLLRIVIGAVVLAAAGGAVIWGYLEGREELAVEAEHERPVKAPLRVSRVNGAPAITVGPETQQRNGIETTPVAPVPYQEEVRAGAISK